MNRFRCSAFVISFAVTFQCAVAAEQADSETKAEVGPQGISERERERMRDRGEYLVHRVAMCVQCHSPRDAKGRLQEQRLLSGAPIPISRPDFEERWAFYAPRLAGLPGWQESEIATLLETGRRPDGDVPRSPMPPFRMSREDARAIAAYLKVFRP